MAYKPRIGLTMRLELETRRFYLGTDYSEAIEGLGGVPLHMSLIPDPNYIRSALDGLDGILLPGCDSDLDPAYFGEEPHPKLGRVVPEKDQTDLLVLDEAEKRGIPVFAICYGMQALNVSRGGTLIQDIESQVENCIKHRQGAPVARNSHSLEIAADSILFDIIGESSSFEKLRVNSHHHQAVKKAGRDLKEIGWANDGVIEGIQDTRPDRWVLGVQWHPELSWKDDELSRGLFEHFVSRCAERSSSSSTVTLTSVTEMLN